MAFLVSSPQRTRALHRSIVFSGGALKYWDAWRHVPLFSFFCDQSMAYRLSRPWACGLGRTTPADVLHQVPIFYIVKCQDNDDNHEHSTSFLASPLNDDMMTLRGASWYKQTFIRPVCSVKSIKTMIMISLFNSDVDSFEIEILKIFSWCLFVEWDKVAASRVAALLRNEIIHGACTRRCAAARNGDPRRRRRRDVPAAWRARRRARRPRPTGGQFGSLLSALA